MSKIKNESICVTKNENSNGPKSTISDCVHKNKKSIGLAGEVATIKKFTDRGIDVYIPLGDNSRADLVADFGGKLQKIQVKTSTTTDNTKTVFAVSQSSFNVVDGKLKLKRRQYTPDEVDYLSLYDYNTDRVFLVKSDKLNKRSMIMRYTPPKNNIPNANYADDYDFDKVLDEIEFKQSGIIDAESFEVISDSSESKNDDEYYRIEINV